MKTIYTFAFALAALASAAQSTYYITLMLEAKLTRHILTPEEITEKSFERLKREVKEN